MKPKQIIFLTIFIATFLILPFTVVDKKVELEELKEKITPYIDEKKLEEQTINSIYKNYNISKSLITDFISYHTVSYMEVDEITIIKQEDRGKRENIQKKLEEYIEKKITTFEGYGPTQVELLKESIIEIKGDYVYLIVSSKAQEINQYIEQSF